MGIWQNFDIRQQDVQIENALGSIDEFDGPALGQLTSSNDGITHSQPPSLQSTHTIGLPQAADPEK